MNSDSEKTTDARADAVEPKIWLGIRGKLIGMSFTLMLFALLVTGTAYYFHSRAALRLVILDHLRTTADVQMHRLKSIYQYNHDAITLVTSRTQLRLALHDWVQDGSSVARQQKMQGILRDAEAAVARFKVLSIVDLDGNLIVATRESNQVTSHRDLPYFQQVLQQGYGFSISESASGIALLRIAATMDLNHRPLGVLIADADISILHEVTRDYAGMGMTGETIIAAPAPTGGYYSLVPLRFGSSQLFQPLTIEPGILEAAGEAVIEFEDYRGKQVMAVVRALPDTDWLVFVKRDVEEAFAPLRDLASFLLIALFITLTIATIVALIFAASLTRPVLQITEVALLISRGDLKRRIQRLRNDELGVLANAINLMADRLVESKEVLERSVEVKAEDLAMANNQLDHLNQQLESRSRTDDLTGIANRRKFDEILDQEWRRNLRQDLALSLIMLDIDHFTKFNQTAGHQRGEQCLQQIARIVATNTRRSGDFAARYDADVFCVLVAGSDQASVEKLAERIRLEVNHAAIEYPESSLGYVTVSIGVATVMPKLDLASTGLVESVGQALLDAKTAGRNRVSIVAQTPEQPLKQLLHAELDR